MSKRVQRVRFFMSCGVVGHMCEEGKKGGRGELKSLYGLPRRNGGGDSIDRNSFVLELEKRFSESRFSWRLDRAIWVEAPSVTLFFA